MDRKHFYGVDLLRGLCALGIVVYHYPHFAEQHPGYRLLEPVYLHGMLFVQCFWMISGFVFSHVYAGSSITAGEFALRRFARLYPLHIITLITITITQGVSLKYLGTTQVIGNFDLYHFVMNVLFITPGWGYDGSFNSPIWSVNVEEIVYAIFFVFCAAIFRWRAALPVLLALLAAAIAFVPAGRVNLFGLCGFYFFAGSALYYFLTRTMAAYPLQSALLSVIVAVAVFSVLTSFPGWALGSLYFLLPFVFFTPVMVVAICIDQSGALHRPLVRLRWVGDATYSIYLWHFPVQVAILTGIAIFGLPATLFGSRFALIGWIVLMLAIGRASFVYLERPIQKAILALGRKRQQLLPQGAGVSNL